MHSRERVNPSFTYLEIGANHPIAGSATFLYYANGFTGTLVEANPKLITALRQGRPMDKIINAAAVAGQEEKNDLHISNLNELSSTRSDLIHLFNGAEIVEVTSVNAIHISKIVEKMWTKNDVTFLSIDVEGQDFDLLRAIDLRKFSFDIIQIEASDHLIVGNAERIINYLTEIGYQFVIETEVNLIFVASPELIAEKIGSSESNETMSAYGQITEPSPMKSFDLFDTLIARRGVSARSAVERLRPEYGALVDQRLAFDDGTMLLPDLYSKANLPTAMYEAELALELDECIPITRNIGLLSDGDLVISDTYFPKSFLKKLMLKAGIDQKVGLYASNLDKYNGKVWSTLARVPLLHTGDNEHSDIEMPQRSGIATRLVRDSEMSSWETLIETRNETCSRFLREVRLGCRTFTFPTWAQIQYEANLILLLSCSSMIRSQNREAVFLGRDCQSLFKIYEQRYGEGKYLEFSRRFAAQTKSAQNYLLKNVNEEQIIVDLVSTGRTWDKLRVPRDVHVMFESDNWSYEQGFQRPERFTSEFKASEIGETTFVWELLNCADHGMICDLIDLELGSFTFAPPELPTRFIVEMHEILKVGQRVMQNYDLDTVIGDAKETFKLAHARMIELVHLNRDVFRQLLSAEERNLKNSKF